MTQEEKQLLLKDLCARLPYRVKVEIVSYGQEDEKPWVGTLYCKDLDCFISDIAYSSIKPYLRPMSSMTEEEYGIFLNTQSWECGARSHPKYEYTYKTFDWLNEHHFDYRGLIKIGLALEAPEGMYEEE